MSSQWIAEMIELHCLVRITIVFLCCDPLPPDQFSWAIEEIKSLTGWCWCSFCFFLSVVFRRGIALREGNFFVKRTWREVGGEGAAPPLQTLVTLLPTWCPLLSSCCPSAVICRHPPMSTTWSTLGMLLHSQASRVVHVAISS